MTQKLTPAQTRVLKALVSRGGKASPYDLAYPTRPLLRRLRDSGFIKQGPAPIYDQWNCDFTITEAGRAAVSSGKSVVRLDT